MAKIRDNPALKMLPIASKGFGSYVGGLSLKPPLSELGEAKCMIS